MKIALKYLIATVVALLIVGSLAAFGNRQLSQSQSSAPNFSAYPLPGTPIPRGSAPIATPTRLAAYPLPGAGAPSPKPGAPLTFSPVSTTYLPFILRAVGSKGTAGVVEIRSNLGFTNELTMGVQWGYNWNHVYTTAHEIYSSTFPYQVVNDIRSKPGWAWDVYVEQCPGNPDPYTHDASIIMSPTVQAARRACVSDIAASHPGLYWLIWNEPDLGNINYSDAVNPSLAAQYFKTISDTIKGADPTARLIVGNVSSEYPPLGNPSYQCCGIYWLSNFVNAYTTTYSIDPRLAIAGYGVHAYSNADSTGLGLTSCGNATIQLLITNDACLLQHFTTTVLTGVSWVSTTDPGKEVWLTEANWQSGNSPGDTWITQTMRMQQMCAQLPTLGINRYAWWYGGYPYSSSVPNVITPSLYLADIFTTPVIYTGTLSPAGTEFINCPN